MENVSITQYTCSVQYAIMDMDADTGSCSVSTLAAREANRARFESETPEEREDHLASRRACRSEGIASETVERSEMPLAADRARRRRRLHQRVPRSERYAFLDAALKVLSKLLRARGASCQTKRLYGTGKSARRHRGEGGQTASTLS